MPSTASIRRECTAEPVLSFNVVSELHCVGMLKKSYVEEIANGGGVVIFLTALIQTVLLS